MAIGTKTVGEFGGKPVVEFSLRSDSGVEVDIMTYGVVVRDWRVPVAGGRRSVVLGFDSFEPYPAHSPYFGAIAGRVANRISGGSFELDGVSYKPVSYTHLDVYKRQVERYIDTPVKRYSSGMYVRLAFAVAAHLESEILIIDEVLAVGDAEFQKKCLGKMKDVSSSGRSVLFVSHNMGAVKNLCNCLLYTSRCV